MILVVLMAAGWLLLRKQQPAALSYEQTCRFLKQWAAYQVGLEPPCTILLLLLLCLAL